MTIEPTRLDRLVEYGRKLVSHHLTTGSGGNLSIIDRAGGLVAITPSGMDYDAIGPEDLVICSASGEVVGGHRKPSSELPFHLALYQRRLDIRAVVHTHSPYATTLACMHLEIPPVHYLVGFAGEKVPLAPYAPFGTPELSKAISDNIGNYNALLLANHGLVAVGGSLEAAFNIAEEIEFVARIYYQTLSAGKPKLLSEEKMAVVLEKFKTYGQQTE